MRIKKAGHDMSSKGITTSFRQHEVIITEGEYRSLEGWWAAAEESVALGLSASAYAAAAAKVAQDNTENTIRQYVSAVRKVMWIGHTMDEFKGIDHLRKHAASYSTRKGDNGRKSVVDRIVADAKGASREDIEAAIAALRKLLK